MQQELVVWSVNKVQYIGNHSRICKLLKKYTDRVNDYLLILAIPTSMGMFDMGMFAKEGGAQYNYAINRWRNLCMHDIRLG